ncbi:MAG: DinB family protein [Gemmatimonadales bacterium]|nr:MAG: DinB family protein [Gemmatimonadales bacterium]
MTPDALKRLLTRDLEMVARQVAAYPNDRLLWVELPGRPNPGGTLAVHVAGNLEHYVGAVLGRTGYVRDRERELAVRGLTRGEVGDEVAGALDTVARVLGSLEAGDLDRPYPELQRGRRLRTGDFLLHLAMHLAYHLGQLDSHRRQVVSGAGALASPSYDVLEAVADSLS